MPPFRPDALERHSLLALIAVMIVHKRAVQPHEGRSAVVNHTEEQAVVQEGIHIDVRGVAVEAVGVFWERSAVCIAATRLTGAGQQTS